VDFKLKLRKFVPIVMFFMALFLIITNFQMLFGTNVYASSKEIERKETTESIVVREASATKMLAIPYNEDKTESIEILTLGSKANSNDSDDLFETEDIAVDVYETANIYLVNELKEAEELRLFYSRDIQDFSNYISVKEYYDLLYRAYMNICNNNDVEVNVESLPFYDTDDRAISRLHYIGIIDTEYKCIYPNQHVTKETIADSIFNMYLYFAIVPAEKINYIETVYPADSNYIADAHKSSMEFCMNLHIFNLDEESYINPKKNLRYDEAICFILRSYKYINKYCSEADPLFTNKVNTYRLLRRITGLNNAAVSGIMASLQEETGDTFDPDIHQWGGGPGYGICQWTTDGRKKGLYDYPSVCGYPYDTLECQVRYLLYELETMFPKLLTELREIPDTSDGAYKAGYRFCKVFEAPRDLEGCSNSRAQKATNYFAEYSSY
jgi:hypothetical protein